jgi:hypothetical protein
LLLHFLIFGLKREEQDEMDRACSTHGRDEKCVKDAGKVKGSNHVEDWRPRHRW